MFLGTVGIFWTIIFLICLVQLILWTLSPRRDKWVRVFCLVLIVGAFLHALCRHRDDADGRDRLGRVSDAELRGA